MPSRMIEEIVRHKLKPDDLVGLVKLLVLLLEAPAGSVMVSTGEGESFRSAQLPASALEILLDAVGLLAARDNVALVMIDDKLPVTLNDVAKLTKREHAWLSSKLRKMGLKPISSGALNDLYILGDVVEMIREARIGVKRRTEETDPSGDGGLEDGNDEAGKADR